MISKFSSSPKVYSFLNLVEHISVGERSGEINHNIFRRKAFHKAEFTSVGPNSSKWGEITRRELTH